MKKILLLAILCFYSSAFAQQDVCCILSSTSGDSVQTFAKIMSSSECKGTFQSRKVCAAVADPENTYCGAESTYKDRCSKCGFFWSGKECLTEDPKEKAKKELEEEAKKKGVEGEKKSDSDSSNKEKGGSTTYRPSTQPAKPSDPDNPTFNETKPEDDSVYSRQGRGVNRSDNN